MDRVQIAVLALAGVLFVAGIYTGSGGTGAPAPSTSKEGPSTSDVPSSRTEAEGASSEGVGAERVQGRPDESADALPTETRAVASVTQPLRNPALEVLVGNGPALLESVALLQFKDRVGPTAGHVELATAPEQGLLRVAFGDGEILRRFGESNFEVTRSTEREIEQRLELGGIEVVRQFSLDPEGYGGELRLRVVNRGDRRLEPQFNVLLYGRDRPPEAPDHFQNAQLVVSVEGDLDRVLLSSLEVGGMFSGPSPTREVVPFGVEWVGVESQYFLSAVSVDNPRNFAAVQESIGVRAGRVTLQYPAGEGVRATGVPPGQQLEKVFRVYLGPKLEDEALAVDARLEPALTVGWTLVRPLVHLFAGALSWIYTNLIGNYGIAIILLTIVLRLGTFPLTQRSMKSMKRLSTVAPQMSEIQKKYSDNPERLQTEMMALYKRTGVNPLTAMAGGCLPMLLQMPFMIALYFALQSSIDLRHAGFLLWIDDLSAPEHFLTVMGVPIRPLPLLMGVSMILQQWLTPSTGGEQQEQQRKMMMLMSGVFTLMFYQFPSGLVLYWLVSNLLGIAQQLMVNREPVAS